MTNTKNYQNVGIMAGVIALGLLGMVSVTAAYQGESANKPQDCDSERHEAMEQAFANHDYESWKELMAGKGRVTEVVNQNNFAEFARSHERLEAGDEAAVREIRQSLGLGLGQGHGQAGRGHKMDNAAGGERQYQYQKEYRSNNR